MPGPAAMITPAYVRVMAAYNAEMNRRLYAAADRLGEDRRKEAGGAFWSSIHGAFNHILWADRLWLARFQGEPPPPVSMADSAAMYDGFEALRAARDETDGAIVAWAQALPPGWLDGALTWRSAVFGRDMAAPRSLLVMHLFNHQTHHRGQAHGLITRAGEATGDTDLPFVLEPQALAEAMLG